MDEDLVRRLALEHEVLITIEENSVGGFAAHVLQFLANAGLLEQGLKVRAITMPPAFIDQDKPEKMYDQAGLNAPHIVATALAALGRAAAEAPIRA
jgi:1-deoxy-D-xylulose-5-phosphate synthase